MAKPFRGEQRTKGSWRPRPTSSSVDPWTGPLPKMTLLHWKKSMVKVSPIGTFQPKVP